MKSARLLAVALLVSAALPAHAGPAPDLDTENVTPIIETIQPGKFRLREGGLICGPFEFEGLDRTKMWVVPAGACIGDRAAAQ
ncbi:hypothetical protein [Methylocystis sp. S23]